MRAAPSADGLRRAPRVRLLAGPSRFSGRQKLALLAINAWPFLHAAVAVVGLCLAPWPGVGRPAFFLLWFFALPAVLGRILFAGGLPAGQHAVPSRTFFRWWALWQLQMVFNRMPWIEEGLRLVPGLYSLWLRAWGARIGKRTLWSPGVRVFDRPLLTIGDEVVVGIDVHFASHFSGPDPEGVVTLTLGPIEVAAGTLVGGGALLGPGVVLGAGQATEALFLGTPFAVWKNGERISASTTDPAHPA
jgi:hypothetical protein